VGLVRFLALHPDGTRLAVADSSGPEMVHLWDLAAGTRITSPGPEGISCVEFTPDGKRLAAVGINGNVHLADARTGEKLLVLRGSGPLPGLPAFTPRIAFSPDGLRIAANSGLGGHLNVWAINPVSGGSEGNGDPSAWIEHAVALWRRGEWPQARDALARGMRGLPDDAGRWIDLGRSLARLGWEEEAATILAKAQSLLERRLSRDPDDEAAGGTLAEVLPDADESRQWTILQPDLMTSAAGATLTRRPDGSVLASGLNPATDTYTVEATTKVEGITALRLEALTDPSLPGHGPGRHSPSGNFHLDGVRLSAVSPPGDAAPVHLYRAYADFWDPRPGYSGMSGTLDADTSTFWSIWPRTGQPHFALFQAAEPIGTGAGTRLRVELASRTDVAQANLGRFRLSVTNRPVPFLGLRLMHLKADRERDGLTRLGAAYSLLGDWAAGAAVLERAAARPDGSALDAFLLALAHHHLGRADEARGACERALARLRTDQDEDATRDVAAEALTTIWGLSLGAAESLLRDAAFPADPFAP
jgi:tetratricopeptide (TPR) repeat protein